MITTLLFDLSRVLLFPVDKSYSQDLNPLNDKLLVQNKNYNFWEYFELNKEVLDFLKTIQDKFSLYMFTSGYIQNNPAIKTELESVFREIFSAEELDLSKINPNSYLEISRKIDTEVSTILFVDDNKSNIDAAAKAGLNVIQYIDNDNIINKLNSL